jgi:hypothetical protein
MHRAWTAFSCCASKAALSVELSDGHTNEWLAFLNCFLRSCATSKAARFMISKVPQRMLEMMVDPTHISGWLSVTHHTGANSRHCALEAAEHVKELVSPYQFAWTCVIVFKTCDTRAENTSTSLRSFHSQVYNPSHHTFTTKT